MKNSIVRTEIGLKNMWANCGQWWETEFQEGILLL